MDRESIINKTRNRIRMDLEHLEKQVLGSECINMSISVCNILDAVIFFEESYLQCLYNCAYSLFLSNLEKSDNNINKYMNVICADSTIKKFITYETPWGSYEPTPDVLDNILFLNKSIHNNTVNNKVDISTVYFLDYLLCSLDSSMYTNIYNQPTYENIKAWSNPDRTYDIKKEIANHFNSFYSGTYWSQGFARSPNITIVKCLASSLSKRNVKTILPINSSYSQVITKIIKEQKKRIYNLLRIFDKSTVPIECNDLHFSKLEICFVKCLIEEFTERQDTDYNVELEDHRDSLYENKECYCDEDELDYCECDPLECMYLDSFLHSKHKSSSYEFFQLI